MLASLSKTIIMPLSKILLHDKKIIYLNKTTISSAEQIPNHKSNSQAKLLKRSQEINQFHYHVIKLHNKNKQSIKKSTKISS